jgi:hypothetical protein
MTSFDDGKNEPRKEFLGMQKKKIGVETRPASAICLISNAILKRNF